MRKMLLKYCYHQILVDKIYEDFDYCLIQKSETFDKDKRKLNMWCKKNCTKKYKLKAFSCWFQSREDADAYYSKWLEN